MSNEFDLKAKEVCDLQKKYGMEPRTDSHLTKLYANGQTDWGAETVAKELVCVDYIFQNTLYGETIEAYMRELAGHVKRVYRLSWPATWEIVRFYGPISLKLMSLNSSSTRIPNFSK